MCQNEQEKKIFRGWFLDTWISSENQLAKYWTDLYKKLLQKESLTLEDRQTQKLLFNDFMRMIWPKYAQVALYHLAAVLKEKPLSLADSYFEDLPATSIKNWEDYSLHQNFVRNDL